MPKLSAHEEQSVVKMLLIGDSGTGKTGALVSLVEAGYKLAILDFDNGLDILVKVLRQKNPDLLENVYYETFKDRMKLVGDEIIAASVPKAMPNAMRALDKGIDDLGPLGSLDESWVVVVDSLSLAGQMALLYHKTVSPSKDPRQNYNGAQTIIRGMLSNLTSDQFKPNVIVSTHVSMVELQNGTMKGLPASIGKALAPDVPKYFNTMLEVKESGGKRTISTAPSALVPTKAPLPPGVLDKKLSLESGLADFFKAFRGTTPKG